MDEKAKRKEGRESKDTTGVQLLDLHLVKSDPDKLYPIIYYALKRTLKEWEEFMDDRPGRLSHSHLNTLADSSPPFRPNQADHPRETSRCDSTPVCRVPQTPFQVVALKGLSPFHTLLFSILFPTSLSQMTCWHA